MKENARQEPLMMHIGHSVFLRGEDLVLIDRRRLPRERTEVVCPDYQAVARAIEDMVVQGAGDIAITAGYGLYLAARQAEEQDPADSGSSPPVYVVAAQRRLANTRPTGYHLAALLERIVRNVDWSAGRWADQILGQVQAAIEKQQRWSQLTGRWAETLLESGDSILTHCYPGAALLYMLDYARERGKEVQVFSTETRPYLQGARLTAWSVSELGIPVTLITDNMAAYCMSQGKISKVFAAADRIALDGTVANKVGTYQLALAAKHHRIPFYILGYGGPDPGTRSGEEIVVEVRDPEEVLSFRGEKITGDRVAGFYPAFDLTPASLIEAIVTDRGVIAPQQIEKYWSLE